MSLLSFPNLFLMLLNLVIGGTIQSITYNRSVSWSWLFGFFQFFLSHPYPYISSGHSTSPVNSIYKVFTKSFLSIIPSLPCLHLCKPSSSFGLKYNKRVFNGPPCFQWSIPTLQMEWLFWHWQFHFPVEEWSLNPLEWYTGLSLSDLFLLFQPGHSPCPSTHTGTPLFLCISCFLWLKCLSPMTVLNKLLCIL